MRGSGLTELPGRYCPALYVVDQLTLPKAKRVPTPVPSLFLVRSNTLG